MMLFLLEMSKLTLDEMLKSDKLYTNSPSESSQKRTKIIQIPPYRKIGKKTPKDKIENKLKDREHAKRLFELFKDNGMFANFFKDNQVFNKDTFKELRNLIYHSKPGTKGKDAPTQSFDFAIDEDLYWKLEDKRRKDEGISQPEVNPIKQPQDDPKEGPEEIPDEDDQEVQEEEVQEVQEEVPEEVQKKNLTQQYEDAQKALASVGIDIPLANLLLPRELKERLIANPDNDGVIDEVVREASKNYAINVYKQRYKDIEDSSFKSFLEEAVSDGLINPYSYIDKNREQHVMYLYGDKPMTEPELREEYNKQRFKNLIKKSGKNKLHEAAERSIMRKREKQKQAYEEMKQTTHDHIRPKMVLNPMLFKHD